MNKQQIAARAKEVGFSLELYLQAMSMLLQSGALQLMREFGKVEAVSPGTPNYVEYQNALFNWSLGYEAALDKLMVLKEIIQGASVEEFRPYADFGGLDKAVQEGNLTKEESDVIREQLSRQPRGN